MVRVSVSLIGRALIDGDCHYITTVNGERKKKLRSIESKSDAFDVLTCLLIERFFPLPTLPL